MPELQIISLDEAQGQGRFVPDYIAIIQQVPQDKAGKLVLSEEENPVAARKWLILAAKAMDIPLGVRRRGRTIYFWIESPLTQEQTTGAQQRRSRQAQPFIIDEEQEETDEMEDTQSRNREGV
jgi:hypothetical protein